MYALDANVFIQAHRLHYAFDFHPGFWDWIDREHHEGMVIRIKAVLEELKAHDDELSRWASARGSLFADTDDKMLASMSMLAEWVSGPELPYTQAAKQEFLGKADFYLVAFAHAHGYVVVTHEVSNEAGKRRVKIPEACNALGVPHLKPHELLRREKAVFELRP
jgi:hypothetical protein